MVRVFLTRRTMIFLVENVVLTVVGWPTWLSSKFDNNFLFKNLGCVLKLILPKRIV